MIAYERPRALWHLAVLGAVIAVCAAAAWTGRSALAGPRPEDAAEDAAAARDYQRQGISIGRTHEVGLAMTTWLAGAAAAGAETAETAGPATGIRTAAIVDAAGDRDTAAVVEPAPAEAVDAAGPEEPDSTTSEAPSPAAADPDPTTADWSACPPISYDELTELLAGSHDGDLPRTDGWGHSFEYCLDRGPAGTSRYTVGVRSPGRDGRWQGDTYPVGGFASEQLDGDLLWIDGYFVTWPRPK